MRLVPFTVFCLWSDCRLSERTKLLPALYDLSYHPVAGDRLHVCRTALKPPALCWGRPWPFALAFGLPCCFPSRARFPRMIRDSPRTTLRQRRNFAVSRHLLARGYRV